MSDNEKQPNVPAKPLNLIWYLSVYGAIGAVLGAIWGRLSHGRNSQEYAAKLGTGIGLASGYETGVRDMTEYVLTAENIELKHRLNELEPNETFASEIDERRLLEKSNFPRF
jgi:hypothetical protein